MAVHHTIWRDVPELVGFISLRGNAEPAAGHHHVAWGLQAAVLHQLQTLRRTWWMKGEHWVFQFDQCSSKTYNDVRMWRHSCPWGWKVSIYSMTNFLLLTALNPVNMFWHTLQWPEVFHSWRFFGAIRRCKSCSICSPCKMGEEVIWVHLHAVRIQLLPCRQAARPDRARSGPFHPSPSQPESSSAWCHLKFPSGTACIASPCSVNGSTCASVEMCDITCLVWIH